MDDESADGPRQDLLVEVRRGLQLAEGDRVCGTADGAAYGGFSVGQLYAVSVHALARPAHYLQGFWNQTPVYLLTTRVVCLELQVKRTACGRHAAAPHETVKYARAELPHSSSATTVYTPCGKSVNAPWLQYPAAVTPTDTVSVRHWSVPQNP